MVKKVKHRIVLNTVIKHGKKNLCGIEKNYTFATLIVKPKINKTMKKVFAVLALVGMLASCNNKKKDEKKPEGDTTATTTTTTTTTTTENPPANTNGVPTFSDPDVQKFANDYAAFISEYKAGMSDPAKLADLTAKMQEWSKKSTEMGMKLATKPEEAKAWADWVMTLTKDMMPK
jgi:PBP1b-binding outer membrane lipoprotein LpoB